MHGEEAEDRFREARKKAAEELAARDPTWMASRAGVTYSFAERRFEVPFCGEAHTVAYPLGEVRRAGGEPAAPEESIIILHYLLKADGGEVEERWVAYRDLPGARYHEPAFHADVEAPLSRALEGRLHDLRAWVEREALPRDLPGDVAAVWYVLPRVPLLLVFNERDEEFPASARVLFDASAPGYLPTEDLEVLAELAAARIISGLDRVR
ncbi:MAG: DUF3786 domain-containing protein [Actinobacteria bacterium]|nr:DUF3786 domain-containing protein [Actinomycetota bacterium]